MPEQIRKYIHLQVSYTVIWFFYVPDVADSYIQISSGFVQLATIENTELDK